jgi:RNA polymerase sigma factor (sigma-70 family)
MHVPGPWHRSLGDGFDQTLTRSRSGDPDAFATIYRQFAPMVLGYMRGHGARSPEDLTGDVFVAAIEKLDSFAGSERQFRSWLMTIAHHRWVDDLRAMDRRPEDPGLPVDLVELGRHRGDVELAALDRLQVSGVIAAIDGLTGAQREVLLLRVLADLPINEIAQVTGRTETGVKALLRRGLASLDRTMVRPAPRCDV